MRRYRIAYLASHPIQYQAPMLRHLNRHPRIEIEALFLSDFSVRGYRDPGFGTDISWDVPLLDGYDHRFLPSLDQVDGMSVLRPLTYGIASALRSGNYDALWVHGYGHHAYLRAMATARALGLTVMLRGDSNIRRQRSMARQLAKKVVLRGLFRLPHALLAVGTLNRDYYRAYGVPDERIFMTPYAVDNEYFRESAERSRARAPELRASLDIRDDGPIIFMCGKLQRIKRPLDLLDAYERMLMARRFESTPYLLYIGDGEMASVLRKRIAQKGLDRVRMLGFLNQSELPSYYHLGDIIVMPSERDAWGLSINEAMNAGVAVVVSDQVGCSPDLVLEGETGYTVPVNDIAALSERLARLCADRQLVARMAQRGRELIDAWSFEACADGVLAALDRRVLELEEEQ